MQPVPTRLLSFNNDRHFDTAHYGLLEAYIREQLACPLIHRTTVDMTWEQTAMVRNVDVINMHSFVPHYKEMIDDAFVRRISPHFYAIVCCNAIVCSHPQNICSYVGHHHNVQ
jgi:hypothetical protein